MTAGWRVALTCNGVRGEAELLVSNAPRAVEAIWAMLPLDTSLHHGKWSGEAAYLHPGPGPVEAVAELENPVTSIYPGTIVMRPRGTEILIGYGVAEYRWDMGTQYVARVGKIDRNRANLLQAVADTRRHGSVRIRIERLGARRALRPESKDTERPRGSDNSRLD